ncbi:Ig-like domain-containing protein [Serratia quinivorans]|uniref:Invasin n=1 Tax=Serratia quinivorans TaxID=137545 RepID=A0A380D8T9_9GAMM|nr:Ig-like domain-containing protein [Serratia quinivorans]CAI2031597.1 Invasin [Serratia quinivorans]SUJ85030.1 Invasin [Serratia quinivorans]
MTAKAGDGIPRTVEVSFVADDSTAVITDANLNVGSGAVADGTMTNAVTARVTDVNGNPLANQTVTFNVLTEGATITPHEVQTGADGNAGATVTSLTVGTYIVTAEVNGKGASKDTAFVADTDDGDLAVVNNDAVANGTATDSVQAKVTDANNNPVSGVDVTFTACKGAKVVTETGADDSMAVILTASKNALSGNGKNTVNVKVRIVDPSGMLVVGVNVSFTITCRTDSVLLRGSNSISDKNGCVVTPMKSRKAQYLPFVILVRASANGYIDGRKLLKVFKYDAIDQISTGGSDGSCIFTTKPGGDYLAWRVCS